MRLFAAMPAVIAAATLCWAILQARQESEKTVLLERYLTSARRAAEQNDAQGMHLNFRRAQLLSQSDPKVTFEYAETVYKMGSLPAAVQMMSGLAATDRTGYLPAHRFLLQNAVIDDPMKADMFRAVHLRSIIQGESGSREKRVQLLNILIRYRRFDQADALLRQTFDQYPEDRLALARMKARAGQISEARKEALEACQQLKIQVTGAPQDATRRIQLAQGYVFLGQFQNALSCLIEGVDETKPKPLIDKHCSFRRGLGGWFPDAFR